VSRAALGALWLCLMTALPVATAHAMGSDELPPPVMDRTPYGKFLVDRLEYGYGLGSGLRADMMGWFGGDYDRFWLRAEGEMAAPGPFEAELEVSGGYSRLVAPFWELQVGLRIDQTFEATVGPTRGLLAVGIEGTAPYWFDIEVFAYLSHRLDVSFRAAVSYEFRFTQRLVGQVRLETNIAIQKAEEFGIGRGLNDLELGFRLRYEVHRRVAPYVGVNWSQRFFEAATLAQAAGGNPTSIVGVAGLRLWF